MLEYWYLVLPDSRLPLPCLGSGFLNSAQLMDIAGSNQYRDFTPYIKASASTLTLLESRATS
jgi:hypothetical protein